MVRTFEVVLAWEWLRLGTDEKTLTNRKGGAVSLFSHCSIKFKPYLIWYLSENRHFFNRKLNIGLCPKCHTLVVELEETRKVDNVTFYDISSGQKANNLRDRLRAELLYSSADLVKGAETLFGFRYGINKEVFNKETGKMELKQYSCDFYGNKELVKKI